MNVLDSLESLEKGNVVLLFTADWCGDCIVLSMYIDDIVKQYDYIRFYKVNSDDYASLAREYNVFGIPSFVALRDGEVIGDYIDKNAKPKDKIESFLNQLNFEKE